MHFFFEVYEQAGSLYVETALPGIARHEIELCGRDTALVICVRRRVSESPRRIHYSRGVPVPEEFQREIALPHPVEFSSAEASLHAGILRVCFPDRKPKQASRVGIAVGGLRSRRGRSGAASGISRRGSHPGDGTRGL